MTFVDLPLPALFAAFLGAAGVIAVSGVRLTAKADRLADLTGMGEAITGAILLGVATSLAGTVVSVTAAHDGQPSLAFSNAVGGIAVQTAFLAVADLFYRRANLEHASADPANLFQVGLLTLMLGLPLAAYAGPDVTFFAVHPVSLALPVVYVAGVRMGAQVRRDPMWRPVRTALTRAETPDEEAVSAQALLPLALRFAGLVVILGLAGWVLSRSGAQLSARLGLSQTTVGALMTAVATSLPELITTLAAVRRGAVQLAVGGIIGGNSFDVLFLSAADVAYRPGSLYHAITRADLFWFAVGIVLNSVLVIGLIVRQKRGPARIGLESTLILALYLGAVAVQVSAS